MKPIELRFLVSSFFWQDRILGEILAYLKMSEVDVTADRYADSNADALSPVVAMTELLHTSARCRCSSSTTSRGCSRKPST